MNYYKARELQKDGQAVGLFHFTVRNDDRIWSVGYCAQDCPGHADREGAERHWYEYELDTARYDVKLLRTQVPCQVCEAWTSGGASVGPGQMETILLCDEHRNREGLERARPFHPGVAITASY